MSEAVQGRGVRPVGVGWPAAWLVLVVVFGVVGCATPPPPQRVVREVWSAPVAAGSGETAGATMTVPEELTLAEAKRICLLRNPDLAQVVAAVRGTEAQLRAAHAAFRPTISLSAGASHAGHAPETTTMAGGDYQTYSTSVSANWLLYDGYARELEAKAARYGRDAAVRNYEDVQRVLAQAVGTAFYEVLLAREQMQIAEADAAFNAELLAETRKRMAAERATRTDELNFQLNVIGARAATVEVRSGYRLARLALAELLGLEQLPENTRLVAPTPRSASVEPTRELAAALAKRPDLQTLALEVEQALANAEARRANFQPTLAATASAGLTKLDRLDFDWQDRASSVGLALSWDVFTGGAKEAAYDGAVAQLRAAEVALERQQLAVVIELRRQFETVHTARQLLALQEESAKLSQENRELERKRYLAGSGTVTSLNEAQNRLVTSQGNLSRSRIRLQQALETLRGITGSNLTELDFPGRPTGE